VTNQAASLYTSVFGLRLAPDSVLWIGILVLMPWLLLAALIALFFISRLPAPLLRLRQTISNKLTAKTGGGAGSAGRGATRTATRQPVRRLEADARRGASS
jgi:hypothetical protein